ncbi:MAG TPA: hypothetical protein VFG30_33535 [Polyangiales bacterium]|nr:hypothetical protein [Polyangiales bacterium]
MISQRTGVGLAVCSLLVISGCASGGGQSVKPGGRQPLCQMPLPREGGQPRPIRPRDWMQLILTIQHQGNGVIAETACTGERIEHTPLPATCEVQTPDPGVPEPVPLGEGSVVEHLLPEGRRIVWIMTHRFPNGDGFGPVAAITVENDTVFVGSLGFLRLRSTRVDLDLWLIGTKTVLRAEGETCEPNKNNRCRRATSLMVYDRSRFHGVPMRRSETNECIDTPWVEQVREADLTLENGWNRHMKISANVTHDQRYVVITEHVDVQDTDPQHPDIPPRDVRRIDTERFIHVEGPYMFTRQSQLWPRIIPTEGRTDVLRKPRKDDD